MHTPGHRTTEFGLTLAAFIVAVLLTSGYVFGADRCKDFAEYAWMAVVGGSPAYALSRGLTKGRANPLDRIIEK